MFGAPDEDNSEEGLDGIAILAKDELNKDERGEAMGVGGLAVGAENEVNEDGLDVVGLVSSTENELESAVAEAVIG